MVVDDVWRDLSQESAFRAIGLRAKNHSCACIGDEQAFSSACDGNIGQSAFLLNIGFVGA